MNRRIYVTSWRMVEKVEQMLRNTGRIPDWDIVKVVSIPPWGPFTRGWRVEW